MHVKCIANKGDVLPTTLRTKETSLQETTEFSLIISKNYLVYAMTFIDGYIWYCICDEHYTEYPTWKPSPLFEVIDGRMSKYWVYACEKESSYEAIWAYLEWANTPHYFHLLTDSGKDYAAHFKHYKKLMDEEFPYPSLERLSIFLCKSS